MTIYIQRIYDDAQIEDIRILVDCVWPRGISKDTANFDYWLKDIAPTSPLRKWFNHDLQLYAAFTEKYKKELCENEEHNQAVVLQNSFY
ncbi:DUF488 domain-containing protein [Staphylococcus casei]|uniref:DUF488 domain-containing protein n=1 Tax=Staphylococcus TaxID=1279 RepID=UPI000CD2DFD6|nr:DUF488 family protein [Staphylococcus casei]PNZ60069.1 DUF488 domain-containing protein [Staphylococcus casei]WJE86716.1 DUF488 family protein [Staphylococcus casei]